jgi:DNA-directed RNA polymerase subunit RPC12/RpoP
MARPKYICPKCRFKLRPSDLSRGGKPYFECPSCNEKLRVSAAYRRFLLVGEVLISIALPFLLGIRDVLAFVIGALVAFFPVVAIFTFLMRSIYPARFEPYEPTDMSLRQITRNHP